MSKHRYHLIDSLRGVTLLSMILYHLSWSLVFLWHVDWPWYQSEASYLWQQSIAWSFIFISGFSWLLGTKPLRRGVIVILAGAVVTASTVIFIQEQRIVFGILTFLGSAMLLTLLLHKLLEKIPIVLGLFASLILFLVTRNINYGHLGFEGLHLVDLPQFLYQGYFMTYLGFPYETFFSADYFSLFPWFFLFLAGYFTFRLLSHDTREKRLPPLFEKGVPPLRFMGRHSLIIYLAHQPLILFILLLVLG